MEHEFSKRNAWSCNVKQPAVPECECCEQESKLLFQAELKRLGANNFYALEGLTKDEAKRLTDIQNDVISHLEACQKRLMHVLSVSRCAGSLARIYNVDIFLSMAAGLLHDWDKMLTIDEMKLQVDLFGVSLPCDFERALPVIHGLLSAKKLPRLSPDLPNVVFQAIAQHTLGSTHASPLSQVIYIADMIEEHRKSIPDIEHIRELVGKVSLDNLYQESYVRSLQYVLRSKRFMIPQSIAIYNELIKGA